MVLVIQSWLSNKDNKYFVIKSADGIYMNKDVYVIIFNND